MPITITSRFKPLTYDEITKPLIEQTQAQHELENAYMAAQDQAAQIMAQANQQTDPQSYARLRNYAEAIQQQADVLMQQGLNRNSRQSLLNLHRRYGQEIMPIQLAATRRSELAEEQRKLMLNSPDLLVERDASTISLDDLVRNPQLNYGSVYNGAMITQRVAQATKALGDSMVEFETNGYLTPYQIKVLEKHGFSANDIATAIAGGDDAKSTLLREARDRVLDSIDVYNKGNASVKERALGYANEGLYAGIGSVKYSHMPDEEAQAELKWKYQQKQMDYEQQQRMDLMEKEYEIKRKEAEKLAQDEAARVLQEQASGVVPTNIYSQQEDDDYAAAHSEFLKYFDVDDKGNYTLNEEGKREYSRELQNEQTLSGASYYGGVPEPGKFRSFINRLAEERGGSASAKLSPKDIGKLFSDFVQTYNTYDATKYTEYNYNIDSSDIVNANNIIAGAAGSKYYTADWDKNSASFKHGQGISIEDAMGTNGNVTAIQISPYGITMKVTSGRGAAKRYVLPRGINTPVQDAIEASMNGIKEVHKLYNKMLNSGITVVETPAKIKEQLKKAGVKEEQMPKQLSIDMLQEVVAQLESAGKWYVSQLFSTNKTEPTKYTFNFR